MFVLSLYEGWPRIWREVPEKLPWLDKLQARDAGLRRQYGRITSTIGG